MTDAGSERVVVHHDPELAWQIFTVMAEIRGIKPIRQNYHRWIRSMVLPIAEALAKEGEVVLDYDPVLDKPWLHASLTPPPYTRRRRRPKPTGAAIITMNSSISASRTSQSTPDTPAYPLFLSAATAITPRTAAAMTASQGTPPPDG